MPIFSNTLFSLEKVVCKVKNTAVENSGTEGRSKKIKNKKQKKKIKTNFENRT